MKKVEGHSDLRRDRNGAVVNVNQKEYERYKKGNPAIRRLNDRMDRIESMLKELLEK